MSPDLRNTIDETDPNWICRVTPDGEVICENPPKYDAAVYQRAEATSFAAVLAKTVPDGDWGPNKVKLLLELAVVLGQVKLEDASIPRRAGQCAQAVIDLLRPEPPSILLFNYSQQPGDVMGAWFQNKAELMRMQRVLQHFQKTVRP
jgi:hypothetical protein